MRFFFPLLLLAILTKGTNICICINISKTCTHTHKQNTHKKEHKQKNNPPGILFKTALEKQMYCFHCMPRYILQPIASIIKYRKGKI